jgi:hypothetical protein
MGLECPEEVELMISRAVARLLERSLTTAAMVATSRLRLVIASLVDTLDAFFVVSVKQRVDEEHIYA